MQTRYDLNALFLLVLLGAATSADAQVQPQLAQRYFEEATKLCEKAGMQPPVICTPEELMEA